MKYCRMFTKLGFKKYVKGLENLTKKGEPDYVNLKGPLDVGGPVMDNSPVPSESFIGQVTC